MTSDGFQIINLPLSYVYPCCLPYVCDLSIWIYDMQFMTGSAINLRGNFYIFTTQSAQLFTNKVGNRMTQDYTGNPKQLQGNLKEHLSKVIFFASRKLSVLYIGINILRITNKQIQSVLICVFINLKTFTLLHSTVPHSAEPTFSIESRRFITFNGKLQ